MTQPRHSYFHTKSPRLRAYCVAFPVPTVSVQTKPNSLAHFASDRIMKVHRAVTDDHCPTLVFCLAGTLAARGAVHWIYRIIIPRFAALFLLVLSILRSGCSIKFQPSPAQAAGGARAIGQTKQRERRSRQSRLFAARHGPDSSSCRDRFPPTPAGSRTAALR
jgi:hypothetical protein